MNDIIQNFNQETNHLQPTSLLERLTIAEKILAYGITAAATALMFNPSEVQAQIPGIGAGTLKPTTADVLRDNLIGVSHQLYNGEAVSQVWLSKTFHVTQDASINFTLGRSQDTSTGQASLVWNPNGDKSLTTFLYVQKDETQAGSINTLGGGIKKVISPDFSIRGLVERQTSPNGQTNDLIRVDAGFGRQ